MTKIYVHGLGQTPSSWERTIEYLGDEDQLCLDLAKMNRGKKVTYSELYESFSNECDRCNSPIALCGLSLGGVLSLNYAIDHPKEVDALILIAAQYKMPSSLLRLQNFLFRIMPQSAFVNMGFSKENIISLCKTMSELEFSGSLNKITCPTLIICGEKDSANIKASKELAGAIKDSRLMIVSSAGHEINTEAPERLSEILKDFYKTCHHSALSDEN